MVGWVQTCTKIFAAFQTPRLGHLLIRFHHWKPSQWQVGQGMSSSVQLLLCTTVRSLQLQAGASGDRSEESNPVSRAPSFSFSSYFQLFILAQFLSPIPIYCFMFALRRELHPSSTARGSAVPMGLPITSAHGSAPCAAFAEGGWGLQQGRDEPVMGNKGDGEQGIQSVLLQHSNSVCEDLEDVLKPFFKTNTYKGITSLCVLLASNGFVGVSRMQHTLLLLKLHFQPWVWGK